jgi:poly-gamma-glutamate synthesis protein (capsule biosynthesis protein)
MKSVFMASNIKLIWIIGAGLAGIITLIGAVVLIIEPFREGEAAFFDRWQGEIVEITPLASPSATPSATPDEEIKILFLGDLMFDRNIRLVAKKNGNNFIFSQVAEWLASQDLVVANLEGPITDNKSMSVGSAPGSSANYIFTFDPSLAATLFDNNILLVSLGNNHILNFGQTGLEATKQYLNSAGVGYFGEPASPSSILPNARSIVKNVKGLKIGLVGYNQFIGNSPDEIAVTVAEIQKVKLQADIVILYAHWGIEYESVANGVIKNLAHQFIDAGADLVIGSHPHVIQNIEEYKDKKIYYSLGNFVFDQYFSEAVRRSLGVAVKINGGTRQLDFEEIKLYLQNNGQTIIIK